MKKVLFLMLALKAGITMYGQVGPPSSGSGLVSAPSYDIPNVIPASPTVSALMQFEEVPVDTYTGIPSISIPIFSMPLDGSLNFAMSASYHPNGVNMNNRSGWLGNGWSLTGLGSISRTVVGKPDEHLSGVLSQHLRTINGGYQVSYYDYDTMSIDERNALLWEAGKGRLDTEPDIFQFNMMGITGRFVIIKTASGMEALQLGGDQKLIIDFTTTNTPVFSLDGGFVFTDFTITDQNGYQYEFTAKETTIATPISTPSSDAIVVPDISRYHSAWHLTKIKSFTGKTLMEINYATSVEEYDTPVSYSRNAFFYDINTSQIEGNPRDFIGPEITSSFSEMEVTTQKVATITVRNQNVAHLDFIRNPGHLEFKNNTGSVLDHIDIKTKNNTNKTVRFHYTGTNRLMLDSITEESQGSVLPYQLEYNLEAPAMDLEGKDFWGYYNGKTFDPFVQTAQQVLSNDFRSPSKDHITHGVLTSITYPTGGKKEFDFEANTISYIGQDRISHKEIPENKTLGTLNINNINFLNNVVDLGVIHVEDEQKINLNLSVTDIAYNSAYYAEDDLKFRLRLTSVVPLGGPTVDPIQPNNIVSHDFALYPSSQFTASNSSATSMPDIVTSLRDSYNYQGDDFLPPINPYTTRTVSKRALAQGYYKVVLEPIGDGIQYDAVTAGVFFKKYKYVDEQQFLNGGGIRIKQIRFTDENQVKSSTSYNYNEFTSEHINNPVSSGSTHRNYKIIEEPYIKKVRVPGTTVLEFTAEFFMEKSNSRSNPTVIKGSHVGYKNVTVRKTGSDGDNGKTQFTYTTLQDYPLPSAGNISPYTPVPEKNYQYGNLLFSEVFDREGRKLLRTENTFILEETTPVYGRAIRYNESSCVWFTVHDTYDAYKASLLDYVSYPQSVRRFCIDFDSNTYEQPNTLTNVPIYFYNEQYALYSGRALLSEVKTTSYFYNGPEVTTSISTGNYTYNIHNNAISEQSTTVDNERVVTSKMYYPKDSEMNSEPYVSNLISQHRIATPLLTESYLDGEFIESKRIEFGKGTNTSNLVLPLKMFSKKGNKQEEDRLTYHKYDSYGNPLEVSQADGVHVIYIWGYNHTYPIAKITNTTYTGMPANVTNLINQIKTASDTENSTSQEASLRSQLENLRQQPFFVNAQMSYYTYDPLVGVTSVTDPRGYTIYYEYDELNRLEKVKDQDDNILSENAYNYKNN